MTCLFLTYLIIQFAWFASLSQEYPANEWEPTRIKWIAENELIIENYRIEVIEGIRKDIYFYKVLTIRNNKP